MIPDTETADDAPEVKVEPANLEEALQQEFYEFLKEARGPMGYHVEYTKWVYGPTDVQRGRIKISKQVPIARAVLKELLTIRGILKEFEEDEG